MYLTRKKNKVRPKDLIKTWKIVTGDIVQIIKGKHKDSTGKVLKVFRKKNSVLVEGVNLVKKHVKSTQDFKGGIFTKEAPIHYSKVQLIDPKTKKPCKVSIKKINGKKERISKISGEIIPKPIPEYVKKRKELFQSKIIGPKDTPPEIVMKQTYKPPQINDSISNLD